MYRPKLENNVEEAIEFFKYTFKMKTMHKIK